jgi:hypothetical protein
MYRRLLLNPLGEPSSTDWSRGEDEIFPDPMSQTMAESWRSGAVKAAERQFAALLAP